MGNVAQYVLDNPDSVKNMSKDIRSWVKKSASETMNQVAFQARQNIIEKASQSMIIRNNFLTSPRVLSVTKVPFGHTESLRDIKVSVGFTEDADFMRRQDEGGPHEAESGKRLRIFTDASREGGVKTGRVQRLGSYTKNKKRTTVIPYIKKVNSHAAVQVRRSAVAFKSGLLMYFKKSLYRITQFEKKGDKIHFEKQMIINREYERTLTPAKGFFLPACQEAAKNMQKLFNEAMDRNVDSH
jgi:hypothetical protein